MPEPLPFGGLLVRETRNVDPLAAPVPALDQVDAQRSEARHGQAERTRAYGDLAEVPLAAHPAGVG
jgi:hypothetical protein